MSLEEVIVTEILSEEGSTSSSSENQSVDDLRLQLPKEHLVLEPRKRIKRRRPREPIVSYGVIGFKRINTSNFLSSRRSFADSKNIFFNPNSTFLRSSRQINFLLYQRRDTFEYIDFIRGAWKDEKNVMSMLSLMTPDERWRLLNFPFEELWNDLWMDRKLYHTSEHAEEKFNTIKDKLGMMLVNTTTSVRETSWEFPKGKKDNFTEDDIECAMREFSEETTIPKENLVLITNIPFVEKFQGTNGKAYSTYYYLCEIKNDEDVRFEKIKTPHLIRKESLTEEAFDARWFTYSEALEKLNPRRRHILSAAREYILDLS